jgi:hypothetical protein
MERDENKTIAIRRTKPDGFSWWLEKEEASKRVWKQRVRAREKPSPLATRDRCPDLDTVGGGWSNDGARGPRMWRPGRSEIWNPFSCLASVSHQDGRQQVPVRLGKRSRWSGNRCMTGTLRGLPPAAARPKLQPSHDRCHQH